MIRIAILADFPVHRLRGYEKCATGHHATWLPPLAKELEAHASKFDFHWIICTKEVAKPTKIHTWGQTFHLLPRRKLSLEILTAFLRERRQISNLLSSLKPDLVHAWGTEQGYALAANDSPFPSLISMQGLLQTYCAAARMPFFTRVQALNERRVLRHATHLTVESPWGRDQLKSLAPHSTIDLLEYGVDPACFDIQRNLPPIPPSSLPSPNTQSSISSPSPSPFQRFSDSASQHLPLALFVGSISLLKGIDTLIAAFSDLRLRDIELVIIGAGNLRIIKHPLPSNVRVLGHLPQADVRDWMSKAWCLVHPTRADTSPNCVKEARVIGLPVITTLNGGQTQYVEHGKSGFIHASGDVEGLIQGVLSVTASRETSLQMGATGQANCRAALTPSATVSHLLNIYQTKVDSLATIKSRLIEASAQAQGKGTLRCTHTPQ
jgi:glycosyltransferase involved in cell wall biosynthesis